MLACYCLQGKHLASGVIGLLTCQSHYNVSVINTTPCARLLLCHPLDQRIPTQTCEWALTHTLFISPPPYRYTLLSRPSLVCPAPCYQCSLCFHSWVAESGQVPAGVRNEGLMSSTIRGPWRSVQEAPSPRRAVYDCLFDQQ